MEIRATRGFTLIEMIVVIVITGIIAGAVAVFIRLPVKGYIDAARRAEMTEVADTALRRMGRDLRLALPNSVRLADAGKTIEFLITKIGARYRAFPSATGATDFLDFTRPITTFNFYGPLATGVGQGIVANDVVVIYNLGPGFTADAYAAGNSAVIAAPPTAVSPIENQITFISSRQFLLESPGSRFQVVESTVSYVCDTVAGTLTRYWGYPINPSQPNAATLTSSAFSPNSALVAKNVTNCAFDYTPGITARLGVATLAIELTTVNDGVNESVKLYHEVHVTNVP